jgi:uncharacterized protein (DUF433 family)
MNNETIIGEYPDFTPQQLQQIIQYYWETLRYNYTNAIDDLYEKISHARGS